jgi:hypothetical protein
MTSLQFNPVFPWWMLAIVAVVGTVLLGRWYWRESRYLASPWCWLLPVLRSTAFFLIVLMLAGPALHHRIYEGEMSRLRVLLDLSRSMAISDQASPSIDNTLVPADASEQISRTRIEIVTQWLLGDASSETDTPKGWLERESRDHRIELYSVADVDSGEQTVDSNLLWDSSNEMPDNRKLSLIADGQVSKLGESVASQIAAKPAALILISDGQNNDGMSLAQATEQATAAKVPVYAIGVGPDREPDDLGILRIEHSQRVFRTDVVRGSLEAKESIPRGTPYRVKVEHLEKVVWEKEFESENQGVRRIEFEIPAESLVDAAKSDQNRSSENATLPIDLSFSIETNATEISTENNHGETSLWGIHRQSRILMLDRRGGWEPRYIKNALTRDIAWKVDFSIGQPNLEANVFPKTRNLLFEYDLIVMTVETISILNKEQQNWIRDFVAESGGGLILIDSKNNLTVPSIQDPLLDLMPVRSVTQPKQPTLTKLSIASNATDQVTMQLAADTPSSQALWQSLPAPRSVRECELSPGSEALLESSEEASDTKHLLAATKLYGQGRIVYMNNDESWRWRYGVADLYHQRFWNQMCNWTMRTPFAVNETFASLDAGLRMITTSDQVTIRANLKLTQNQVPDNPNVQAVLLCNDEPYAVLPMARESDSRGFYRVTTGPFPEGRYRVQLQASGIPQDALAIESDFLVQSQTDLELASLSCNTEALKQIARTTGGQFLALDQAESISDLLQRFQTGKWTETVTLLWQSYPWFATMMTLLALEWILRKRSGLI